MKRYDSYKPSGIEWIGEIPSHWEVMRFKDFMALKSSPSTNTHKIGLENIESQTGKYVETDSEFDGNGVSFIQGDILYGKLRPYLQKVWLAEFEGNAVGDFFVFSNKSNSVSKFLKYLLLSDGFTKMANGSTEGAKMPRVASDFILSLHCCLPPFAEQEIISEYLDKKCGEIDRWIATRQRRIELLEELKQSVITQAVTRGLDPNVPLRDSGIEWIGKIPEHWKVSRLKYFLKLLNGRAYSQSELLEAGKYRVLRVGNLFTNDNWYYSDLELEDDKYCNNGDLLYAWSASFGPYIWNGSKTIYHYHIWKVQYDESLIDKMYAYYFLKSVTNYMLATIHGSTMVHITMGNMNEAPIVIPPINEQKRISSHIKQKTAEIDSMIEREKKKIELIQELKQSIITEVVTGKRKVVS